MFLPISGPREVGRKNEAEQSLNESPLRRWCSLFSLYKLFTSSRKKKWTSSFKTTQFLTKHTHTACETQCLNTALAYTTSRHVPFPVLGSLARFVVDNRLGLATAICLDEAVGEPAPPDGLAVMSLCRITGWEETALSDATGSLLPCTATLPPWRRAGE